MPPWADRSACPSPVKLSFFSNCGLSIGSLKMPVRNDMPLYVTSLGWPTFRDTIVPFIVAFHCLTVRRTDRHERDNTIRATTVDALNLRLCGFRGRHRRQRCEAGMVQSQILMDLANRRGLATAEDGNPGDPHQQIDEVEIGEVHHRRGRAR